MLLVSYKVVNSPSSPTRGRGSSNSGQSGSRSNLLVLRDALGTLSVAGNVVKSVKRLENKTLLAQNLRLVPVWQDSEELVARMTSSRDGKT